MVFIVVHRLVQKSLPQLKLKHFFGLSCLTRFQPIFASNHATFSFQIHFSFVGQRSIPSNHIGFVRIFSFTLLIFSPFHDRFRTLLHYLWMGGWQGLQFRVGCEGCGGIIKAFSHLFLYRQPYPIFEGLVLTSLISYNHSHLRNMKLGSVCLCQLTRNLLETVRMQM